MVSWPSAANARPDGFRSTTTSSQAGAPSAFDAFEDLSADPVDRPDHDDCSDEIQRALRTLSDVGIAIYPVDSRGVMGAFETTSQEPRLHTFPAETARKRRQIRSNMSDLPLPIRFPSMTP